MKILFVKLSSIGDIVHTLPTLAAVRRALPVQGLHFAVHFGDIAVTRDCQDAIPHAGDQAAEEPIGLAAGRTPPRGHTDRLRPPTDSGWHQGFYDERQTIGIRAFHGRMSTPKGANAVPDSTHAKCV